jgi:hypothetical protein
VLFPVVSAVATTATGGRPLYGTGPPPYAGQYMYA